MPEKELIIYDTSNNPLKVVGIRFELFDSMNCTLLHSDNSENLDPAGNPYSRKWGVKLPFNPVTNPVDVYVTDPKYRYPGNTIRHLNGEHTDTIRVDLMQLPLNPGGQSSQLDSLTVKEIIDWVKDGKNWEPIEQAAVINLITNYLGIFFPRDDMRAKSKDFAAVAENWEKAIMNLGIPIDLLSM